MSTASPEDDLAQYTVKVVFNDGHHKIVKSGTIITAASEGEDEVRHYCHELADAAVEEIFRERFAVAHGRVGNGT